MELKWVAGSPTVRWSADGLEVVKEHPRPVRSAAFVPDPPSVVIVEEPVSGMSDEPIANAVVCDLDGAERVRLEPPRAPDGRMHGGFDQCFHDSHGVVAVYLMGGELTWAYADVRTGELGLLAPFR